MRAFSNIDMMEATRLTREGRLEEAMAILRGAPAEISPPAQEGDPQTQSAAIPRPFADPSPPAYEAPSFALGRINQLQLPKSLRGFLDRLNKFKPIRGLDGLVRPTPGRSPIKLPEGARFETRMQSNAAGSRAYKLYVPSGYRGQALPLVVMLHGCTQSPDDFAAGTRMNELAEEQTFLVAYPAQAQSANASKCWNWFQAADQQRDQGEPSLIADITRAIMREFAVDPARVFIAGLSAGGAAAAVMGSTYPDLYAAIGVHSGLACGVASDIPSAFAAMKQGGSSAAAGSHSCKSDLRTIVFHGDRDTTVNPVNGDQIIAQAKGAAQLRTTVSRGRAPSGLNYTRTVQADDSGMPILEQWILHGAGHAWSGGDLAGSYTDPRGPDASREMMRFFLEREHTDAPQSPKNRNRSAQNRIAQDVP